MHFDEIVKARRSIRRYQPKAVDEATLAAVMEAGRLAPSAKNEQNWRFVAVRHELTRQKLARACYGQNMVAEAPAALVAYATQERTMACGQSAATVDCSIAMSFMVLKATELGLGTCWLGAFDQDAVKKVLQLPQNAVVVAVTPLGWPGEDPAPRPRKPAGEVCEVR